jgi:radical SAM protein with 4Fe4S-binding SPASM domain
MKNNFCVIPWVSITSDNAGLVRPCCKFAEKDKQREYSTGSLKDNTYEEIWNGTDFRKIRQAFIDNKQIPECSSCWNEEAAGLRSYRNTYNKSFLEDREYGLVADPPKVVDLKLSNVCNFKCRMCNYEYSSLILKEDKIHRGYKVSDESYYLSNKILDTDNESYFFDNIVPNLVQIEFTGGEPFVSPEARKVIKLLAQSEYSKNITVQITTNGSIINKGILSDLQNFKQVRMAVSIDDIGPRLEYQRKGAAWDTIQNNILTLKSQDWISLNIHPTINNYNIWDIDELLDWADDHKISTVINVLHGPERLCIKNLHDVIKEKILEKHGDDRRIHNVLTYMSDNRDTKVMHFIGETEFIDNIRNEAFKDIFPEWSKLIYDYM